MSRTQRDRYRKKLGELLSHADDEEFCQLVWALDALQSDRVAAASPWIEFPSEAATTTIGSKLALHKWELEALVSELLITPKYKPHEGKNRHLNCRHFDSGARAVNFLRTLEAAEAGIYLKRFSILLEMHRLGQRQFPWQRGYSNAPQFYRAAFLYNHGECAAFFERSFGISINDFSLIGFALFSAFMSRPLLPRACPLGELGVSRSAFDAALGLLSRPLVAARREARETIDHASGSSRLPVAYQPSFLRRFPLIEFGGKDARLRAPLLQLILLRITSGIYYDLVRGNANLRNESSERFELYCAEYIAAMMPRFDVSRGRTYRYGNAAIQTPDILVKDGGEVTVAVECKATKLTFNAQFAEAPEVEAKRGYDEIAKGVFQIWRYFSHVRRGVIATDSVRADARGLVLTLDTWFVMSRELQEKVLDTAVEFASRDQEIRPEDRRDVVFCAVQDLEATLSESNEEGFLRAMAAAGEGRFVGWLLPKIREELEGNTPIRKPYPFDVGNVLPWWRNVQEIGTPLDTSTSPSRP
jgi:hypothetical protein